MIPFLELSKQLAAKGILISYVSTPKNLQRLPPIPSNLAPKINLIEIPIPSVNGLPENCEATIDLQHEQIPYLGRPDELKTGKRRPSPEYYTSPPDWIPFPSLVAHRPDYAPKMMRNTHFPDESGFSSGQRVAKILECSSFVAVRSCNEFEGEYIDVIQKMYERPVLPIGVLPPVPEENTLNSNRSNTLKWLDEQKTKSVIFVGFGSEYKMPIEQIHELAFSVELSKLLFLWILRKPQGVDGLELLPPGFMERTVRQGIVVLGWQPQLEILAHPAIGGCLFHSGWGTIVESLGFGHPLILLPMVGDQGLNAKLLVEKELGHEVPMKEDGSFSRDVVAESIRLVMVAPAGELLRSKSIPSHSNVQSMLKLQRPTNHVFVAHVILGFQNHLLHTLCEIYIQETGSFCSSIVKM